MPTTIEVNKQSVETLLGSGNQSRLSYQNTSVLMLGLMNR